MSAKGALEHVQFNDRSMANSILPTKRGRRKNSSASSGKYGGAGDAPHQPGAGRRSHYEGALVHYDHCCGIHGAMRERRGIKKGTSAARRRHAKTLIQRELTENDRA